MRSEHTSMIRNMIMLYVSWKISSDKSAVHAELPITPLDIMLPSIISHNVRKELSKFCKTKNEGRGGVRRRWQSARCF